MDPPEGFHKSVEAYDWQQSAWIHRGKLFLTNLITFYNKVTCSVDTGQAVDVAYLDFSKTFDMVSHGLLLGKLTPCSLGKWSLQWVGLTGCTRGWW